jgi:glycolate dehydrogenase FAD-binding subunit
VDLTSFADEVGADGLVTISGLATRGGPVPGVRAVRAPAGIVAVEPDELIVRCGAGTPVAELDAALAENGQSVALPASGTVGGALASGRSGLRRLGDGPVRDALLQVRYVSAEGREVRAGGPTVKNVSGFDLCRLLVGSWGTLGFFGEVILRTRPRPALHAWYAGSVEPFSLLGRLYRPTAVLWDGVTTWVCLEGHPDDVRAQAALTGLDEVAGPPPVPTGGRECRPPSELAALTGEFLAEVGVGVVHRPHPVPPRAVSPEVATLHRRLKAEFDPHGRLNPGVDPLER